MRISRKGQLATFLTLVLVFGLVFSVAVAANAKTLTVPSSHYSNIKAALDAAGQGDKIRVVSSYDSDTVGEFFPIEVLVKEITIKCESGARIAVPHSRVGITVSAKDVTIDGCLIESHEYDYDRLGDIGIVIDDVNGVTLSNLIIRGLNAGIVIIEGANNVIYGNTIYDIGQPIPPVIDPGLGGIGIYLEEADSNTFSENVVYNCGVGLKLYESRNNTFNGDVFGDPDPTVDQDGEDKDNDGNPKDDEGNAFMGVYLEKSDYNEFNGEPIEFDVDVSWNYGEGFVLVDSHNNKILNSTIVENGRAGIKLLGSDNNDIEGNTIENNGRIIGAVNHIEVHNDNKAVQIIVSPGESVEFRADFTPPETTGSGMLNDIIQEKARTIEKVDGLQERLIEVDDELLRLMQKYDSALGIVWQIKEELERNIGPTNEELRDKVRRLLEKLFKIEAEKWLIEWKKVGSVIETVQTGGYILTFDKMQEYMIEIEVQDTAGDEFELYLGTFDPETLTFDYEKVDNDTLDLQGKGDLYWTCTGFPSDPYNPGEYLPGLFQFMVTDGTTPVEFTIACVPEFPFIQTIEDEKNWIFDEILALKQKVHKLYELKVLSLPLRDELLQKLDGVIGILLDIDVELEIIDFKLLLANWVTPTYDDIYACFYPGGVEELDPDTVYACLGGWTELLGGIDLEGIGLDDFDDGFRSLMIAKLLVKLAIDEFANICLVEPSLQPTPRQCEGSIDKINLIWEKLVKFDEELPPPPFELNGENLVAKMDDHSVDKEQICGNDYVVTENGKTYCSCPSWPGLVIDIAEALNNDDEAYELALQRMGRPWWPADIYFERVSLGGSTGNQICSNVIRNFHNALADNIGIELMPGSSDNIICNNLITNEELTGIERGETYQAPGKLTIGIKLVADQNKIVYNALEYLNIGIVRGIPKDDPEYNEDVKHIQIFKKLALKRCTQVDPPGVPIIPECENPKKIIVRELLEEYKIVEVEGKARFNRLSLNLFEKVGISIDVRDAESNVVDENLFYKSVSGAIVLDRLESHNVLDIQMDFNDFIKGFSVVNMTSHLPVDAKNNYFYGSPTKGDVDPSYDETKGAETVYGTFNCPDNFTYSNMAAKFPTIAAKDIFIDDKLPPNTNELPSWVLLPTDKPRTCEAFEDNPGHGGTTSDVYVIPERPATNLNEDPLLEDVNGNGRLDFDDAVQLALHIDQIALDDQEYFDFNGNGRLDFDDAVRLAFKVGGEAAVQALKAIFGVTELSVSNITASPNPVAGVTTVNFTVEGVGVATMRVEIYDLGGKLVFDSDFVAGNTLAWNLMNERGEALANGVYLYIVTVKGVNGEIVRSEVRKLVVLR